MWYHLPLCIGFLWALGSWGQLAAQSFACPDTTPIAPCSAQDYYCTLRALPTTTTQLDLGMVWGNHCVNCCLEGVDLDRLSPNAFQGKTELHTLKLPAQVPIPRQVGALSQLRHLEQYPKEALGLEWYEPTDQLHPLPAAIGTLSRLEVLKVYTTALPMELAQLRQLRRLTLVMDRLETSDSAPVWSQLSELDIVYWQANYYAPQAANWWASLPPLEGLTLVGTTDPAHQPLGQWLGQLHGRAERLRYLYLSTHQQPEYDQKVAPWHPITTQPVVAVLDFPALKDLTLRYCNITDIALPEGGLRTCKRLNLAHNQLSALPIAIGQAQQLETLDLSHNGLTTLPHSIGELKQLKRLSLRHNPWYAFPEALGQLQQLEQVIVSPDLAAPLLTQLQQWFGERVVGSTKLPSDIGPNEYLLRQ